MKRLVHSLSTLVLLLSSLSVMAENSTRAGEYTIHHNALTTDSLPAQVASAYGLQRSTSRGLLNVSVIRGKAGTIGEPVRAKINVTAKNLYGQIKTIELREIVEDKAIYYIADFPVANREMLHFQMEVVPEGESYPVQAQLTHEFYTE